jgi:hypothetical protein
VTFGTVTLGTLGIEPPRTPEILDPLETLGVLRVGFEIVGMFGNNGTAL